MRTPPAERASDTAGDEPWEKFGWVMATVWLVFLFYPIQEALRADRPTPWRWVGVLAILAFAAVYVRGFVRTGSTERCEEVARIGYRHLAVLLLLVAIVVSVIGADALAMATYLVAFSLFTLPLPVGLSIYGGTVAACALVPLTLGRLDHLWGYIPLVTAVGGMCAAVRLIDQRQAEHRQLQDEITLSAERDRVARDVHDVLGHSLTVVTVKAELAERLLDVDLERARAELVEIRALSRTALAEIRATVAGLRVARLTEELEAAERALTAAGITVELPAEPAVVDPRHRITLAWATREAVTNTVRHSGATRCSVTLGEDWLEVRDDGRGVNGHREGNGLRGLRERVTASGGSVTVGPSDGDRGTMLRVQL